MPCPEPTPFTYDVLTGPGPIGDAAPECPECCRIDPVHAHHCSRLPQ